MGSHNFESIKFSYDDTNKPTCIVKDRTTAISRLHGGRNLNVARIIVDAGQGGYVPKRGVAAGREGT